MSATTTTDSPDGTATFDAFASGNEANEEATKKQERARTRRGGPRAPLPLLPLIGLCAGIGIAYVAQTAHLTQTSYQETTLLAQQQELKRDDASLGDQLARLRSPSRITEAAQRLGLHPPQKWAYVDAVPPPVAAPAHTGDGTTPTPGTSPLEHVVQAMSGSFGGGSR